jgi:multisubunit Na+/H+ antiporter MnhC subunit
MVMMNLQQVDIARRSANRLAEHIDPQLPQKVEAELSLEGAARPRDSYAVDLPQVVAIAGLVIQAATFALDVYLSRKHKQQPPDEDTLKELIKNELQEIKTLSESQKGQVAEIVAQETLKTQS